MLLMIDNYDSFTYNLVQYFGELGAEVRVFRNDEITVEGIGALRPDQLVLSPGPCSPAEAGVCVEAIRAFTGKLPILGVCLGHQAIGAAFGTPVVRAPELLHGKTSEVFHDGTGVLAGVPSPVVATRYHSLAVEDSLPPEFAVTARTASGVMMALRHRSLPIEGVQFHPESVLTQGGHRMLANWLRGCGAEVDEDLVRELVDGMDALRARAFAVS
jgi:para-aminobenzoate synthetase component II